MSSGIQLTVQETGRDRYARQAQLKLGALSLPTPHFGVLIRTKEEFELFLRMRKTYPMNRATACVMRMFDATSSILT